MATIRCPFFLKTSHGRSQLGFGATRIDKVAGGCSTGPVECLGLKLDSFVIVVASGDRYALEATGAAFEDDATCTRFLDEIEVALTAHFAGSPVNAYYGTPFVELDRFNAEFLKPTPASGGTAKAITGKMHMTDTEHHTIVADQIPTLRFNPLLQLYADGLRATRAESKFFHWFIILEEFLEKNVNLNKSFVPLFGQKEATVVRGLAGLLNERQKGGLLNSLNLTESARHEKLSAILHGVGIAEISAPGTKLPITPELCDALIKQRNQLFHRGKHINEDQLYNVLLPIASILAGRSTEFVAMR